MAPGVDDKCRSTVRHIQMHAEILVDALQHLHLLTGGEKACGMRWNGVGLVLEQDGAVTAIVVHQVHQIVVHKVGSGQMHVFTHRQVQRIAGLVGVHDVFVVLQAQRISMRVVERQVHIVGVVGKDIAQKIF